MRKTMCVALAFCAILVPQDATASKRGEGAIVVEDETPIYKTSKRDDVVAVVDRGSAVAAVSGFLMNDYYFNEKNGRVRVNYFPDGSDRGDRELGWVDPDRLSTFTYDCQCGEEECSSTDVRLNFSFTWTVCFKEGRDAHLKELQEAWDGGSAVNEFSAQEGREPEPARLALGQSPAEVKEVLGEPETTLDAGDKLIYLYPSLKLTFVGGELSTIE